jgi:hypothetical protein
MAYVRCAWCGVHAYAICTHDAKTYGLSMIMTNHIEMGSTREQPQWTSSATVPGPGSRESMHTRRREAGAPVGIEVEAAIALAVAVAMDPPAIFVGLVADGVGAGTCAPYLRGGGGRRLGQGPLPAQAWPDSGGRRAVGEGRAHPLAGLALLGQPVLTDGPVVADLALDAALASAANSPGCENRMVAVHGECGGISPPLGCGGRRK